MCGKDLTLDEVRRADRGSPPHVRERPDSLLNGFMHQGITPACAGKTKIKTSQRHRDWDHPRMCGKDCLISSISSAETGSPPHVRERLSLLTQPFGCCRITPACAGKTIAHHGKLARS